MSYLFSEKGRARALKPLVLLGMLCALVACDNNQISETLGMNREAPDEFTVVSRPPLSLPPEFTLRPPQPGAAPLGATAEDTAHGLLLGKDAKPAETIDTIRESSNPTAVTPVIARDMPSMAEERLLKRAGADKLNANIRTQLLEDETAPVDTSKATSLMEKIGAQRKEEPVVDAEKESERLRANKDAGKPVNEGEVPVQKPSNSLFDRIF